MRYLLLSSILLLLSGCSSVYKNLRPANGNVNAISKFKPDFTRVLYKAEIDVTSHHLSGLLLIKKLPDSSSRIVFSNEMGLKFFDFGFKPNGSFKVYYIIKQMNKKPVIKTLKKDFELIMMDDLDFKTAYLLKDAAYLYYIFPRVKGSFCYLVNLDKGTLNSSGIASPHKPIVKAIMNNYTNNVPDTIGITHLNFKFNIGLKRIH